MFSIICVIIYVKCICHSIVLEQSGTLYNGLDQTRSSLEMVWNSLGRVWDSLERVWDSLGMIWDSLGVTGQN